MFRTAVSSVTFLFNNYSSICLLIYSSDFFWHIHKIQFNLMIFLIIRPIKSFFDFRQFLKVSSGNWQVLFTVELMRAKFNFCCKLGAMICRDFSLYPGHLPSLALCAGPPTRFSMVPSMRTTSYHLKPRSKIVDQKKDIHWNRSVI